MTSTSADSILLPSQFHFLPLLLFFFFNDTATTEIYTLSLHDALPISVSPVAPVTRTLPGIIGILRESRLRSEEHTSELQSRLHLVCRLLLEKKKKKAQIHKRQLLLIMLYYLRIRLLRSSSPVRRRYTT